MPAEFRRTKRDIGAIVVALEAHLAARPGVDALMNAEAWL